MQTLKSIVLLQNTMSDCAIPLMWNGLLLAEHNSILQSSDPRFRKVAQNMIIDPETGQVEHWILAYHRCLKKWIVMERDESRYGRSLRKFRKKLRFNLAAGIFVPNLFISLTLAPHHYEEILHPEQFPRARRMQTHRSKGSSISVSSWVRDFFQQLRKQGLEFKYAWRVECGTQNTRRPHVHILLQLPEGFKPQIHIRHVWNKRKKENEKHYQWDLVEKFWSAGDVSDAKELRQDEKSYRMVTNYISKYFSKNSKEGELEPDPKSFAGQRYNTSRDLVSCPRSCFNKPEDTTNSERVAEIEAENQREEAEINALPPEEQKELREARALKWMHASYWFEGVNPGTQMRDYIFKVQNNKRIRQEKAIAERARKKEKAWNLAHPQAIDNRTFDEQWAEYESNFHL